MEETLARMDDGMDGIDDGDDMGITPEPYPWDVTLLERGHSYDPVAMGLITGARPGTTEYQLKLLAAVKLEQTPRAGGAGAHEPGGPRPSKPSKRPATGPRKPASPGFGSRGAKPSGSARPGSKKAGSRPGAKSGAGPKSRAGAKKPSRK